MAPPDSQPGNEPSITYFDEDGDTRLLLTRGDRERTFVVSSKAMSVVCLAWKSLLSPNSGFKEATLGSAQHPIPLPDDDPGALAILLNITHMHFARVPETLTFESLLCIAEMTEKYGAVKILRPWIKNWLKAVDHLVYEPGYEEFLFIAWAFGEKEIFDKVSIRLVRELMVDKHSQCPFLSARILDTSGDTLLFPAGIIERILEYRLQVLNELIELPYQVLDVLLEKSHWLTDGLMNPCKHYDKVEEDVSGKCRTLIYGSLVLFLELDGLGREKRDATNHVLSVDLLAGVLRRLRLQNLGETRGRWDRVIYDHSACTPDPEIGERVAITIAAIPTPASESHDNHMEQKRIELYGKRSNAEPTCGHRSKRARKPTNRT